MLSESSLAVFKTGVQYQMIHALAILAIVGIYTAIPDKRLVWAGRFMTAGVVLFSGSLYVLATTTIKWVGPITPIGGVCFLIGWACVAIAFLKQEEQKA